MYTFHQKRHTTQNEGQRILLERQGTLWEGKSEKALPAWMKEKTHTEEQQNSASSNLFRSAHHLAAMVLGIIGKA